MCDLLLGNAQETFVAEHVENGCASSGTACNGQVLGG
jgi:hypothetical protein